MIHRWQNVVNFLFDALEESLETRGTVMGSNHGHYGRLAPLIRQHFAQSGASVEVDPPGRGVPDVLGTWPHGDTLVGEIKSARESRGASGAWWGYWNRGSRQLASHYSHRISTLSGKARGWCAVIDGQLREYCDRYGSNEGHLVVEDAACFDDNINEALQFLAGEGRLTHWNNDGIADGVGFYRVVYG